MDSLEQLVSDTLGEHAAHAPEFRLTGRSLTWRLDAPRRRRPWGRWIGSAITVAAVTMFAISLGLGWWSLNGSETASNGAAQLAPHAGRANGGAGGSSGTAPSAPADGSSFAGPTRRISYHGITLEVPAALPVYGRVCGRPRHMVVTLAPGGMTIGCPTAEKRRIAHVVWLSRHNDDLGYASLATRTTTVHGIAVRTGFGLLPHSQGVSGVVVIPSESVVVGATFPTRAEVAAVLGSVRVG